MAVIDSDNRIPSVLSAVLRGSSSRGTFSGTLIASNLVLGSKHTTGGRGLNFNGISANVIYTHRTLDIALYELQQFIHHIEPLDVAIPTQLSLNLGNKAVGFSADFRGRSEDSNEFTNIVGHQLRTELDMYRGASGGPILNYQNKVVGVISEHIPAWNINIADAINLEILDIIEEDVLPVVEETLDIKRFLNTETVKHYYTSDEQEIAELLADERFVEERSTLVDEGYNLYKFWNTTTDSYFYTRDTNEYLYIKENLPHFEYYWEDSFGVAENTLHRLYEPSRGYHFYCETDQEMLYLVENLDFIYEGYV